MDAERDHAKSELEQFKVDIASAMKQKTSLEKALVKKVFVFLMLELFLENSCYSCCNHICTESNISNLQEKSLDNIRNQIEQIQSSIAMKNDEMGTDLIDQLTSEERDLLTRLNPEITELKERFLLCKNSRIEVVEVFSSSCCFSQEAFICSNAIVLCRLKQERKNWRPIYQLILSGAKKS